MKIFFKTGVDLSGIDLKMFLIIAKIAAIFESYSEKLTITSALDGTHLSNSLHYKGLAIDIRTRDLSKSFRSRIVQVLTANLGETLDIIDEIDHIHIEYDPLY
jgi:hypothetical protein